VHALIADIRYALRLFSKNPGTTAVAVLSLAIAIGPNAALFSLIDHLVFRPSPVKGLDGLFSVQVRSEKGWERLSYPDYLDYRDQSKTPVGLIAYVKTGALWDSGRQRELMTLQVVSENYFATLGIQPLLGRMLDPSYDTRFSGPPPVVISDSFWHRRLAAGRDVIGKTMLLNGRGFTIVGVAASGFRGLEPFVPTDVWMPFSAREVLDRGSGAIMARRDRRDTEVLARLRPDTSVAQAEAELVGIAARLAQAYPATNKGKTVVLRSEERDLNDKSILGLIVMSLVSLVLLIACANVAGLLLAQGEARRREIAVRLALGARRAQLVRQLLVENALISLAAAGVGLLLAWWIAELLPALRPPMAASLHYDAGVDWRVVAYTLLLALATTFAFGLAPALRGSRPDLLPALRGESKRRGLRLISIRGALVVGQIAAAQFLLVGAGLLLRSYAEVETIRPGFDPNRNLLLVGVMPSLEGQPTALRDLLQKLRALPGVRQASFSRNVPLSGQSEGRQPVSIPGVAGEPILASRNAIGPAFCAAMGTRVLRGREFDAHDRRDVALINETMARQLWGGPDAAIGRFFRTDNTDWHVVGVVEDGKYNSLTESPAPYMFVPALPESTGGFIVMETATDPRDMAVAVRRTLLEASPNITIFYLSTLRQHLRLALFAWQTGAGFVTAVGLLGIFLGSVGLYGVVSYSVNRRAHEIGVRVALGAQTQDVLGLVLRQALWLVATGAFLGVAAALFAARIVSALFYKVSPADPLALGGSLVVVAVITLLATHVPARRALRVDPIAVLRQE
jgi:predicted permease